MCVRDCYIYTGDDVYNQERNHMDIICKFNIEKFKAGRGGGGGPLNRCILEMDIGHRLAARKAGNGATRFTRSLLDAMWRVILCDNMQMLVFKA